MFYNIISLILIYSFFSAVIFSAGKIGNNYIFKFKNLNFGEFGILGFVIIYFVILVVHFFYSISDYFIYFTYLILIFYFLLNSKIFFSELKISRYKLGLIFLVFIFLSITNNHHDDLYIFQLPIINYMQNFKIVFGLINLNDFIGQGHSFYEIMSFFKVPIYENRVHFLLPIIFLNFFVIYLFEKLKAEKNYLIKYFIYFIIILLIVRFSRSKEYGTDIPILCLLFYIQLNFLSFLNTKNFQFFLKSILASIFCIILKLYGITSLFYLLAFIPILKKDLFKIFKKKRILIFFISMIFLTLVKNFIVSGCLFYPISKTCFDKENISWAVGKEVTQERNEFYNAQVKGWRAYTKNINGGEFINAKDYLEINTSERIKGLLSDKDFEKILTGLILPTLFILVSIFFKEKIKINKINISSNILIILLLFAPLLIWLILFPQSRYGYFSYISIIIFYISFNYLKVGKFNKRLVVTSFSILLIFLVTKNVSRIKNEILSNIYDYDNYPIKKFRSDGYTVNYIDNIKFNVPLNSFMECSDIPMFCMSNINMINTIRIKKNYYFLEGNSEAMKEHIKSSALYDMIETN
jgi:hypothetical protein